MNKRPGLERTKTTIERKSNGIRKLDRTNSFQLERNHTSLGPVGQNKSLYTQDSEDFSYVAAIEIGTSFSSYAYCQRREGKSVAQHIEMNPTWVSPDKTLKSLRTPTCLLLDEKKEFVAFGYEAEKLYLDLVKENRHHKAYYFRRYKTKLFGIKELRGTSLITDENGRQCSVMKVFSMTMRYLKSHIMNEICIRGKDVEAEDIRWVVTVPASWTEAAKQFWRRAAENAGIPGNMLKLCLEPEAASIFCQNIPPTLLGVKLPIYKSGARYALADIGGGLTDIVVHEKRKDGLREISRGMGAKLGGDAVDNIFIQFLNKLLGEEIVDGFMHRYKKDFIAMMHEFEQEKKKVTPEKISYMELKIPACLQVLCQRAQYNDNISNLVFRSVYQGKVKVINHRFRIDAVITNELFRAITVEMAKLITHALSSIDTAKDVSVLVSTGGFAKVEAVQEILHQNLINNSQIKQIIVPPDADLAVVKGAVIFGNNPLSMASRVVRETLGLRIARLFNPEMHELSKKTNINGIEHVVDIFSPFLTIGTRVPVGFISHQSLTTTEPMQRKIEIDIYHSTCLSHNFITDTGCERLGKLDYQIPLPSEEGRTIYVDLLLGDTEIVLLVTDKKTMLKSRFYFPSIPSK